MPWFILIAGPNGAGKTTLTGSREFERALRLFPEGPARLLNPDDVSRVYFSTHPGTSLDEADAYAANAVPATVERCIKNGENVAVETVLSSDKYAPLITLAHKRGYQVGLIYLTLDSAGVSKARVEKRVASGGHPAPLGKLADRWVRSLDRLVKFAPLMDGLLVYQSSSARPTLLAEKHEGKILWYAGEAFPQLKARLRAEDATARGPGVGSMPISELRRFRKRPRPT